MYPADFPRTARRAMGSGPLFPFREFAFPDYDKFLIYINGVRKKIGDNFSIKREVSRWHKHRSIRRRSIIT
jgi:hypothetical protein